MFTPFFTIIFINKKNFIRILSKNLISTIQKNNFDSFKQLDVLDLHDNRISGKIDFTSYLKKLTNLRILNLSGNQIGDIGAEKLFAALPEMTNLEELTLYNNQLTGACEFGF